MGPVCMANPPQDPGLGGMGKPELASCTGLHEPGGAFLLPDTFGAF